MNPSLLLHRVFLQAFALLWVAFLCGCSQQNPLSDSQKSALVETLDSAGRAYDAARESAIETTSDTLSSDSILHQMMSVVRDKIKTKDCQVKLIAPSPRFEVAFISVKRTFTALRVQGSSSCPIDLNFKISTLLEPSIGRWAISLDYSYKVINKQYRAFNDIDSIELHGGISSNGIGFDHVRRESDLKGKIHSQQNGMIDVDVFGQLEGADLSALNGDVIWKFTFPTFMAELTQSYDSGSIGYSINGNSIDQSIFDDYFRRSGEPFIYSSNPSLIR